MTPARCGTASARAVRGSGCCRRLPGRDRNAYPRADGDRGPALRRARQRPDRHGRVTPSRHPGAGRQGITVLVPGGQDRESRAFVRVWPTTRMPEFVLTDGAVRFTRAARAVADAARELGSFREVRAVTADAVQRRRCRLDDLSEELAHAPVRRSAWLRRALAEVADGVRSVAEGDLRDLITGPGCPTRCSMPGSTWGARSWPSRTRGGRRRGGGGGGFAGVAPVAGRLGSGPRPGTPG